jgi:hypothetical protein
MPQGSRLSHATRQSFVSCHMAIVCLMPHGHRLSMTGNLGSLLQAPSYYTAHGNFVGVYLLSLRQHVRNTMVSFQLRPHDGIGLLIFLRVVRHFRPSDLHFDHHPTIVVKSNGWLQKFLKPRLSTSRDMYPSFNLRKTRSETAILA